MRSAIAGTAKLAPAAEKAGPARCSAPAPVAAAPKLAGASDEATKKLFEPGSFTEVPHDGMRKTIARRLVEAKTTIPHFYLTVDCELDALLKLREQVNASAPKDKDGKPAFKVSVNDFIIKALALALQRVPDANVTWTEAAMLKHSRSDVGVAVSIPGGLITPVVRSADTKDALGHFQRNERSRRARARTRKLKPEEYQGRNLGGCRTSACSASRTSRPSSIRPMRRSWRSAQVRNASSSRMGRRPVATIMSATLSTDHRAVDGALEPNCSRPSDR